MTKWDRRILSIRDEELRKRLGIESLDEILDRAQTYELDGESCKNARNHRRQPIAT